MVWNCGRSSPRPSGHLNRLFFPLMQSINTHDSDDYLILSLVFLLSLSPSPSLSYTFRSSFRKKEEWWWGTGGRMQVPCELSRSLVRSHSLYLSLSLSRSHTGRRVTPLLSDSALFSSFDSMPKHPLIRSVPYTYFDWTDTFQYCTGPLDLLNTPLIGFTWISWRCLYVDCNLARLSVESVLSVGKSVKKKQQGSGAFWSNKRLIEQLNSI